MDVQYRIIGGPQTALLDTFEPALFVLSTAISQPVPGRVTVDAGYKALTNENVAPQWLDRPEVTYGWGGDEHGILRFPDGQPVLALGESIKLFIAHCDPTVNLYDTYHVVRDGQVVDRWPITARGCSQ
jgi:D-serine deaminase-like pyridoxal phosphate-dependent protein